MCCSDCSELVIAIYPRATSATRTNLNRGRSGNNKNRKTMDDPLAAGGVKSMRWNSTHLPAQEGVGIP